MHKECNKEEVKSLRKAETSPNTSHEAHASTLQEGLKTSLEGSKLIYRNTSAESWRGESGTDETAARTIIATSPENMNRKKRDTADEDNKCSLKQTKQQDKKKKPVNIVHLQGFVVAQGLKK